MKIADILVCLIVPSVLFACHATATEMVFKAKGELIWAQTEPAEKSRQSWFNGGTGQLHYADSQITAGPQYLSITALTDTSWSALINAQWHRQPETGVSVTEAWLNWAPLPVSGYRLRGRLGYFYPQMSLENTDTAWTSPYSSSFSAINSWLAEEVRARGGEISISRPGRFFQSSHSWSAVAGAFQGNDPAGAILAWRGFAIHNQQTGIAERVNFARYPSLQQAPLQQQPAWVEPHRELDHRTGYYLGMHWQYEQTHRLRAYYYDNNADPAVLSHGQYAWRTRFSSLAYQQSFNDNWQLVAQWLSGSSEMGPGAVDIDFNAWFALAHYQSDVYWATLRYDHFAIADKDPTPTDDNNGRGRSLMLSVGYQLSSPLQLSAEHIWLDSKQNNRAQQWPWPAQQIQSLTKVVLTWRW